MIELDALSFHESTVVKFVGVSRQVVIRLEDVGFNQKKIGVQIVIADVESVEIDSNLGNIDDIFMPESDGEVLTFEVCKKSIYAIIEWNNFTTHSSYIRSYRIFGLCGWEVQSREVEKGG